MALQRDGADRGPEVEESGLPDAQPVGQVAGIGQRRGQADEADLALRVGRDEVGPRDDDFENGATVLTQQVDFVDDYQSNSLEKIIQ